MYWRDGRAVQSTYTTTRDGTRIKCAPGRRCTGPCASARCPCPAPRCPSRTYSLFVFEGCVYLLYYGSNTRSMDGLVDAFPPPPTHTPQHKRPPPPSLPPPPKKTHEDSCTKPNGIGGGGGASSPSLPSALGTRECRRSRRQSRTMRGKAHS